MRWSGNASGADPALVHQAAGDQLGHFALHCARACATAADQFGNAEITAVLAEQQGQHPSLGLGEQRVGQPDGAGRRCGDDRDTHIGCFASAFARHGLALPGGDTTLPAAQGYAGDRQPDAGNQQPQGQRLPKEERPQPDVIQIGQLQQVQWRLQLDGGRTPL